MPLTTEQTLALQCDIGEHLDAIKEMFKPGTKITCVIRPVGHGDASVVIGDDDLDKAIEEIKKLQARAK